MAKAKLHFSKREAIDFGLEVAKKNLKFFILLFVLVFIIYLFTNAYETMFKSTHNFFLSFIFSIIVWVINVVISIGVIKITLEFVDKKKPQILDVFYTYPIVNYILVSILRTLIILGGLILLIIPGIILAIKFQFAEYLIVDKNMGVMDSLKKSWEMTKGVKWNLFVFGILLGLINLLGLLFLVIGLFVTVPLSLVAEAYVYRKLYSQV